MLHGHRLQLLGAFSLSLCLSACGAGSSGGSSSVIETTTHGGTATATVTSGFSGASTPQGTSDGAVATSSAGTIAVVVGASRTVSISFTSTDGRTLTGLALSDTVLPAGWSGPANFSCAAVNNGSACVVNMSYSPTTIEHGTLKIAYVFLDNAAQPQTGATLSIPYESTPNNNVIALASPSGQINAVIGGGSQSVRVNFITDDGKAAAILALTTDLTTLPPGWSSSAPCPATAIISTGSGCQLVLTYAPSAAGTGTLTLDYTFVDAIGNPQSGTLNIPYAATTANNVTATSSPTGQILAVQNSAGQPVVIAFNTDDGKTASGLTVTSDLSALPVGWSSPSRSFACATVGSGNGCLLQLTYAPTALDPGLLTLSYTYKDGSGAARNGLLNVAYAGTTNDVVVGTASTAGQIQAVITNGLQPGNGTQTVSVSFATGDGRPATALHLLDNGNAAPAGWSYDPTFHCSGLNVDSICRLPLAYTPLVPGSGTLMLNYAYINNAGEPKTGSVNIDFRATTNDNVVAMATPVTLGTVRTGSSNTVTVVFDTDDMNTATGLAITSGLASLPAGWSSASPSFTCGTVSTGSGCTLTLTYAPGVAVSGGLLTLGFAYVNNAGYPGTGTVTIPYGAYTPYLYVVNATTSTVSSCALNIDDSVAPCVATGSGFMGASTIALSGSYAYVTNTSGNFVSQCALGLAGALTNCAATGNGFVFSAPTHIAVNSSNTFAYVESASGLLVCSIVGNTGALTGCAAAGAAFDPLHGVALSSDGTVAFGIHVVDPSNPANSPTVIERCVAATGAFSACASTTVSTPHSDATLVVQNGNLYTAGLGSLYACPLDVNSTLSSCQTTAIGTNAKAIAFLGSSAFVVNGSASLLTCPLQGNGTFGTCISSTDPTFAGASGVALRH